MLSGGKGSVWLVWLVILFVAGVLLGMVVLGELFNFLSNLNLGPGFRSFLKSRVIVFFNYKLFVPVLVAAGLIVLIVWLLGPRK